MQCYSTAFSSILVVNCLMVFVPRLQTLSLLCSSLAWQRVFRAAVQADRQRKKAGMPPPQETSDKEGGVLARDDEDSRLLRAAGTLRPAHTVRRQRPDGEATSPGHGNSFSVPGVGTYEYEPVNTPQHAAGPTTSTSGLGGGPMGTPLIVYASRTHSQLSQVARELKATSYRPAMTVLASREQLCVHPEVKQLQGTAQAHACRTLCHKRKCGPRLQLEEFLTNYNSFDLARATLVPETKVLRVPGSSSEPPPAPEVMDIEDLVKVGQTKHICPYYWSREGATLGSAELVLMPYNFLVDSELREQLPLDWSDSLVIVDEAHNLEAVCADTASFDCTPGQLARCVQELDTFLEGVIAGGLDALTPLQAAGSDGPPDDSAAATASGSPGSGLIESALRFKEKLLQLERILEAAPMPSSPRAPGLVKPGRFLFEMLAKLDVTPETWETMAQQLLLMIQWLQTRQSVGGSSESSSQRLALEQLRKQWSQVVRLQATTPELAQFYRVLIHPDVPSHRRGDLDAASLASVGRTLSFLCFSPGVAMLELQTLGVRSIVLTSGTLSPMESYAAELRLSFPIRLENPHVVDDSQVDIMVVGRGPMGTTLNSKYSMRDTEAYKRELGMTVANVARLIPDGVLVFFPSYRVMEQCVQFWKSHGDGRVWDNLAKSKQLFVEARSNAELAAQFEAFDKAIERGRGALFCAVCRGKVSEGLDFADRRCRAVIVTGLPYPPVSDPKVMMKREFLDDVKRGDAKNGPRRSAGAQAMAAKLPQAPAPTLSGEQWYTQQASRAVNQAIGRVIRHRNDWGVILLCDERFGHTRTVQQLSAWLRPRLATPHTFGDLMVRLRWFLQRARAREEANAAQLASETSFRGGEDRARAMQAGVTREPVAVTTDRRRDGEGSARGRPAVSIGLAPEEEAEARRYRQALREKLRESRASRGGGNQSLLHVLDRSVPRTDTSSAEPSQATPRHQSRHGTLLAQSLFGYGKSPSSAAHARGGSFAAQLEAIGREQAGEGGIVSDSVSSLEPTPMSQIQVKDVQPPLLRVSRHSTPSLSKQGGSMLKQRDVQATAQGRHATGSHPKAAEPVLAVKGTVPPGSSAASRPSSANGPSRPASGFVERIRKRLPSARYAAFKEVLRQVSADKAFRSGEKNVVARGVQRVAVVFALRDPPLDQRPYSHEVKPLGREDARSIELLGSKEDRQELLRGFIDFLPSKARAHAAEVVESLCDVPTEAAEPPAKRQRVGSDGLFSRELTHDLISGKPLPPHRRISLRDSPARANSPSEGSKAARRNVTHRGGDQEAKRDGDGAILRCPVCLGSSGNMLVAPCGHTCCDGCWDRVLDLRAQCPVCRQHTRRKHLTKIFLET